MTLTSVLEFRRGSKAMATNGALALGLVSSAQQERELAVLEEARRGAYTGDRRGWGRRRLQIRFGRRIAAPSISRLANWLAYGRAIVA